jgi:hypothetical protein
MHTLEREREGEDRQKKKRPEEVDLASIEVSRFLLGDGNGMGRLQQLQSVYGRMH